MPIKIDGTDLLYFPVPKNACTSIKMAVLEYANPDLHTKIIAFQNSDLPREQRPPAGMAPGGRPLRNVHDVYPSRPFKAMFHLAHLRQRWFCVIRDPLKRFLSAYSNRLGHLDDLKASDPEVLAQAGLSRHPDLEDFVMRLDQYCRINASVDHHFRPTTDFLGTRPRRFDRVFTMAELDEVAPYCAEAGAPLTLPHLQTGGAKLKPDVVTAPMHARLKTFYAADYRHWGAFF